jgi:hypothetical protein
MVSAVWDGSEIAGGGSEAMAFAADAVAVAVGPSGVGPSVSSADGTVLFAT